MTSIDLLTKVIKAQLQEYADPANQWVNTQDFCLEDIIGKDGEHLPSFLYQVRQLSQLKGRKVKDIRMHIINDKDCAVDATIGFFRIELEPI